MEMMLESSPHFHAPGEARICADVGVATSSGALNANQRISAKVIARGRQLGLSCAVVVGSGS